MHCLDSGYVRNATRQFVVGLSPARPARRFGGTHGKRGVAAHPSAACERAASGCRVQGACLRSCFGRLRVRVRLHVHAPVRDPANDAALVKQHQAVRRQRACWLTPPHPRSCRTHSPVCAHSRRPGSHDGARGSHTRCSTLSTSVTSWGARTTPRPAWQMRNVLLNLVQLSVVVAGIPTGLIMKLTRPPVLHGRKLNQVLVSSVAELTAAVSNSAVDKILVAAGTYEFTSEMCGVSAICIDRNVIIEAQVPGSVVFDARGSVTPGDWRNARRVFEIQRWASATLIGLDITGGSAPVQSLPFEPFAPALPPSPQRYAHCWLPPSPQRYAHCVVAEQREFLRRICSFIAELICSFIAPAVVC